jgi:hypothetical protein
MVLAAKGVHAQDRDDLLQETALRLYRVWETLEPEQPVWPFAVTIALNLWRDQVRAAVVRQRDVLTANLADAADPAASYDVERTVLARHELAQVSAVMQALAPEQRRLLLENEEVSAVVAPLRPAERMARMRARRELARMVGRASAALALLLWRRPVRVHALATAACAGVLAATVMTNTPYTWPEQAAPTMAAPRPVHGSTVSAPAAHLLAVAVPALLRVTPAHVVSAPGLPGSRPSTSVPSTRVCAPADTGGKRSHETILSIGPGGLYEGDPSDGQPVLETPPMQADDAGCVQVG